MTTSMGRSVPLRQERVSYWSGAVYAGGVAGILAVIVVAAGWRGSDLPAELFPSSCSAATASCCGTVSGSPVTRPSTTACCRRCSVH